MAWIQLTYHTPHFAVVDIYGTEHQLQDIGVQRVMCGGRWWVNVKLIDAKQMERCFEATEPALNTGSSRIWVNREQLLSDLEFDHMKLEILEMMRMG